MTTGVTSATWTGVPLLTPLLVTTAVKLPAVTGRVVRLTVKDVEVAAVIDPTAPLSNVMESFANVVSNPSPAMMTELAFAARNALLLVTTGATVPTCVAVPLAPFVTTVAFNAPAVVGGVVSVTVNWVAVAAETVPTAPLLNVTVLFEAVVSKPSPSIRSSVSSAGMLAGLLMTSGTTVATCTAEPLLTLLDVTMAVRFPAEDGSVVKVTVNDVAVAAVTIPTALLLKVTLLFETIGSKPEPLMTTSVAEAESEVVASVTETLRRVRSSRASSDSIAEGRVPIRRVRDLRRRVDSFCMNRNENRFKNEIRLFRGIVNLSSARAIGE